MIATGIVCRIDELGRIAIPKELRNQMGIKDMYKVFLKDCFLGQADTYSKAVTIAWNYASSINLEFSKEIKQPFGRVTLIFCNQNREEHFIIAKGE